MEGEEEREERGKGRRGKGIEGEREEKRKGFGKISSFTPLSSRNLFVVIL